MSDLVDKYIDWFLGFLIIAVSICVLCLLVLLARVAFTDVLNEERINEDNATYQIFEDGSFRGCFHGKLCEMP